ncbi:hypothetical protein AAFC00_001464 [Neodothiora populina]
MSPHAEHPDSPQVNAWTSNGTSDYAGVGGAEGAMSRQRCLLRRTPQLEVHDLVCIGFGPASLAIAVALHDALEAQITSNGPELKTPNPKVAFLERQPRFAWHAGMQIPGAKMQISFMKDLATFRNPRSEFTFINYLFQNNRLVQFTNLSTFLPRRVEYEDYMRWAAGYFEDVVSYGEEVVDVRADETAKGSRAVSSFTVISRNIVTRELSQRRAKNVVVAVGGRPKIPKTLPQNHPRVIHSSQYWTVSSRIFPDKNQPLRIAVIGGGQSAAEIFNNITEQFPNSQSVLLIKGAALRPSDDSPFVNEIFDPDRVDDIYSQDPEVRSAAIALDKATNYGVVRIELIEHIYTQLYTQRLKYENEEEWPQRLLNHRTVERVTDLADSRIRLHIRNDTNKYRASRGPVEETLDVDLVMVAAGYERDVHEDILKNVRHLMPGGDVAGQRWSVGRDYRVKFGDNAVAKDSGIYLQGCNEKTHGLSDSLLSVLANRGGEMVESMFGLHDDEASNAVEAADSLRI